MSLFRLLLNIANTHPTAVSVVITGFIAWVLHRVGISRERRSILNAVNTELEYAKFWLRTAWPESRRQDIKDFNAIVFRIMTTAVENAIGRGGGLFLNNRLIDALVSYNQAVSNLNLLSDTARDFQANTELWDPQQRTDAIYAHAVELNQIVHISGIGGEQDPCGHTSYRRLRLELDREINLKVLPMLWLFSGINLFRIKNYTLKYVRKIGGKLMHYLDKYL